MCVSNWIRCYASNNMDYVDNNDHCHVKNQLIAEIQIKRIFQTKKAATHWILTGMCHLMMKVLKWHARNERARKRIRRQCNCYQLFDFFQANWQFRAHIGLTCQQNVPMVWKPIANLDLFENGDDSEIRKEKKTTIAKL